MKVTFNQSAGDSPDDYYIVLLDPETRLVAGMRYIVTNQLVYPDAPAAEKLLTMEGFQAVGGLLLPTSHRTFAMDGDTVGDLMRSAEALEYKWLERSEADLDAPEGAKTL